MIFTRFTGWNVWNADNADFCGVLNFIIRNKIYPKLNYKTHSTFFRTFAKKK